MFISHIWSKLRRDSEYQIEEVQVETIHFEHFSLILLEFDFIYALKED